MNTCFKKTCNWGCESGSTVTSNSGIKILSRMFWNDVTIPISLYTLYRRGSWKDKRNEKLTTASTRKFYSTKAAPKWWTAHKNHTIVQYPWCRFHKEQNETKTKLSCCITVMWFLQHETCNKNPLIYASIHERLFNYLNQPNNILAVQFIIHYPTSELIPLTLLPTIYWYSVFSHLQQQNEASEIITL